jgi:phospholipid/cholesterol/gamma-HCH transport system substrate-binding protein
MASKPGDHIRLGLFVMAGSLLLIVGLYMLGSKRNLFRSTVLVSTTFQNAAGLRPGNNVRYAGINVGTVEDVRIINDTSVRITMAIREDEAVHILDNAIANLGSDGLMGNKLVNIGPGHGTGTPIADGSVLASSVPLDTDQMMRTLDRTNANMAAITDDLRELSARINRPGGVIHVLSDTALATNVRISLLDLERSVSHVRNATANVDAMLADVRAGKGALGMLVSDPAAEQQVRQWLVTMQQLADSLSEASAQVDRFAKGLNTPGGLGQMLTQDTAVAGDVRRTIQQLEKSSYTLDEDLKALQSNWFFRGYFKDQEKAKAREQKANEKAKP